MLAAHPVQPACADCCRKGREKTTLVVGRTRSSSFARSLPFSTCDRAGGGLGAPTHARMSTACDRSLCASPGGVTTTCSFSPGSSSFPLLFDPVERVSSSSLSTTVLLRLFVRHPPEPVLMRVPRRFIAIVPLMAAFHRARGLNESRRPVRSCSVEGECEVSHWCQSRGVEYGVARLSKTPYLVLQRFLRCWPLTRVGIEKCSNEVFRYEGFHASALLTSACKPYNIPSDEILLQYRSWNSTRAAVVSRISSFVSSERNGE